MDIKTLACKISNKDKNKVDLFFRKNYMILMRERLIKIVINKIPYDQPRNLIKSLI